MKKMTRASIALAALALFASISFATDEQSQQVPGGHDPNAPAASVGAGSGSGGSDRPERFNPGSVLDPGHGGQGGGDSGQRAESGFIGVLGDIVFALYNVTVIR
ncbi:MAG: hypothetical protein U0527_07010 [Candidatus Eisenbacteria bacterium]